MLEVKSLNYKIPDKKTDFEIKGINFRLETGYFMGLLGGNGAGKSTLLRLLYGVLRADRGDVLFYGQRVVDYSVELHHRIGYLGDETIFFESQTVYENAKLFGALYPEYKEADFLSFVKGFELNEDIMRQRVEALSLGQKKQVQLAFVLARHPKLLLLDEPMGNLDAVCRVRFMELLQERIAQEGISIVLSTHLPDDIEDIVDYIGVLEDGQMKAFGEREDILNGWDSLREMLIHDNRFAGEGLQSIVSG